MMKIRNAVPNDLTVIMDIYKYAKQYMKQSGNLTQWGEDYPSEEVLLEDIRQNQCYVGYGCDGKIHCVFSVIIGEEPTYAVIRDGAWKNEKPYGTIHRLAGDGSIQGIFETCLNFCKKQIFCERRISQIRIDTHRNNHKMRYLIEKHGFEYCGIIYVEDASERMAYQLAAEAEQAER